MRNFEYVLHITYGVVNFLSMIKIMVMKENDLNCYEMHEKVFLRRHLDTSNLLSNGSEKEEEYMHVHARVYNTPTLFSLYSYSLIFSYINH